MQGDPCSYRIGADIMFLVFLCQLSVVQRRFAGMQAPNCRGFILSIRNLRLPASQLSFDKLSHETFFHLLVPCHLRSCRMRRKG